MMNPCEPAPDAGRWWKPLEDGALQCHLCPRACRLRDGQRGFCFVRQNQGGRLVSTTYGRSTGFCVDPIEKKPLNHFLPGTSVLSFGTAGCNLGCRFCQNWHMSKAHEVEALSEEATPGQIAQAALRTGCRSVAFTYNDPVVWAEYAMDTAKACREVGVKTVAVTAGYITPAARSPFFALMDAANVDLKGFSEEFYWKLSGGHLEPVLDTLRWLAEESDVWLEITNLVIPQANDSGDEIARMCDWIVESLGPDVPVHFTAFHPDFRLTDRDSTPPSTLSGAWEIARRAGLRYVYTGNVHDPRHQSTLCPGCGRVLIERNGYDLGTYALKGDRCADCGARIAGRFGDGPGDWGSRRLPVRIKASASRRPGRPRPTPGGSTAGSDCDSRPAAPPASEELAGPKVSAPQSPQGRAEGAGEQGSKGAGNTLAQKSLGGKAEGDRSMANEIAQTPAAPDPASGRPGLSQEQEALVFRAAGQRVAAAVCSRPAQRLDDVLGDAAQLPLLGAFVSLKRAGQLRSCCGFLGPKVALHEALDHAALRAAKDDPRFPPISSAELPYLDMDVWLLWNMQPVAAKGLDRVKTVEIGTHGLQISRGGHRGLLLPGVAVDHHLDAEGFLRQVCLKAGLPPEAWKDDDTTLMTFEGYAIQGKLSATIADGPEAASSAGPTLADVSQLAEFCRGNLIAELYGATPNYYLQGGYDGGVNGAVLTVRLGSGETVDCSMVSVRSEMPLQSTLFNLARVAADNLRAARVSPAALQEATCGLSVFWDPAMHGTVQDPDLAGIDPRRRALVVVDQGRWAIAYDPSQGAHELLDAALGRLGLGESSAGLVVSMAAISTEAKVGASNVRGPQPATSVRAPAVAGQFYPARVEEVERTIDALLPRERKPQRWAGVLVPHAGWVYSGRLAAQAFSRIAFPSRAIVVCPKHRPGGAEWAVAPYERWALPGREVPSDPELARRLADAVPELKLDAETHRHEHAIEVQLPLVARLAPTMRVVGIAMHGGDFERLARAAELMAGVLRELDEPPLLIISSDMNHYADDDRTRKLDSMALEAIQRLDPRQLYDTVTKNRISMCGVLPAVLVMETLRRLGSLNRCESVGYATSAEASGDRTRVVGYAAALFA